MPIRWSALLLLIAAGSAAADEVATPVGRFELPDGFVAPDDAAQVGANGWTWTFVREGEVLPRALFTLTVMPLATTWGIDARVAAAQLADPTMIAPTGRPARRARIGGNRGWRHSTIQANGMIFTAYAVDHGESRLLVQLRYPGIQRYHRDAQRFEDAIRAFRWEVPDPAAAVAGPAPESPAEAPMEIAGNAPAEVAADAPAAVAPTALPAGDAAAPDIDTDTGTGTDNETGSTDGLGPVWSDVRRRRTPIILTATGEEVPVAMPAAAPEPLPASPGEPVPGSEPEPELPAPAPAPEPEPQSPEPEADAAPSPDAGESAEASGA
ncbi:hypothetical protein [Arenimonas composti]|uniref:hypothetical protein n=1 Tax=Arenimonas composti TaxID=370776 RepID=UPI0003FF126F|nr:hypothetical protein [Arenimonas composti]